MNLRYIKIQTLFFLIVGPVSALQQGCSFQPNHAAWEGHLIDDLISSWGEPDSINQLGVNYASYTWKTNQVNCEHTFTVSDALIIGHSSSDCEN